MSMAGSVGSVGVSGGSKYDQNNDDDGDCDEMDVESSDNAVDTDTHTNTGSGTRRSTRVASQPASTNTTANVNSATVIPVGDHWLASVCPRLIRLLSLYNHLPVSVTGVGSTGVNPYIHIYLSK